jgi:hypothetical protein
MIGTLLKRRERWSVAAIAIVLAVTGGAVALAGAKASPPALGQGMTATFVDRFDAGFQEVDCSARAWPYLGPHCLRRPDGSRLQPVRVIAIDMQVRTR